MAKIILGESPEGYDVLLPGESCVLLHVVQADRAFHLKSVILDTYEAERSDVDMTFEPSKVEVKWSGIYHVGPVGVGLVLVPGAEVKAKLRNISDDPIRQRVVLDGWWIRGVSFLGGGFAVDGTASDDADGG